MAGRSDEPMGSSSRVMNSICVYIYIYPTKLIVKNVNNNVLLKTATEDLN
jgi:hypothetical protein